MGHNSAAKNNFRLYGLPNQLECSSALISTATAVTTNDALPSLTYTNNLDLVTSSSITIQPTFEPILNIPAFTVFLFIMSIFVSLQIRIRAIDTAAFQRNVALQQLRKIKALELSDPTLSQQQSDSSGSINRVQNAVQEYQRAYNRMEELRTIVPGIRIVSPPSPNFTNKQQLEHEMAAQQFLGIVPEKENDSDSAKNKEKNVAPSNNPGGSTENPASSSSPMILRNVLLVFVALTQIALFLFLIGTDPMMSSLSSGIRETTTSTIYTDTK